MRRVQVPNVIMLAVGLAWGSVLALNAPGHLSYDSVVQLAEGRSLTYQSMHPPLMSAFLGIGDRMMPGTGLYLAVSSGIFFLALVLLSMRARRPIIPAALIAIFSFSPLVLIYQGIIWKDVLFANLAVLAFAILYEACQRDDSRRLQIILYCTAAVVAGLSALVRQNGLLVPVFLSLAIGALELRLFLSHSFMRRWMRGGGIAALAFTVSMIGAFCASGLVRATAASPPVESAQLGLRSLFLYDVVAIAARVGTPTHETFAERGVDPVLFVKNAQDVYTPERIDYISISGALDADLARLTETGMGDIWGDLVLQNPGAYIAHRFAVLGEILWPTKPERCLPIHMGVSGPDTLMEQLGLAPGLRSTDRALYTYTQNFVGTGVMTPISYLFIAVGLIGVAAMRRQRTAIPSVFMLLAAVSFALSYIAIGIACDLRYAYFLILAVVAGLVHLGAMGLQAHAQTSEADTDAKV